MLVLDSIPRGLDILNSVLIFHGLHRKVPLMSACPCVQGFECQGRPSKEADLSLLSNLEETSS